MLRPGRAKTVLAVAAIGLVLVRAMQAWQRAATPFQIDYAEGTVLAVAFRIVHGEPLYPAIGAAPYFLAPYGPLGYLLAAATLKIFGLSLFWPRLVILGAAIVAALLIAALTRAVGGRRDLGALGAAAFFCSPLVWIWLPLVRVDLIAVALSLAGLWSFLSHRHAAMTAALLAAAVCTKQTAVAALLTCVVLALTEARPKEARNLGVWLFAWGAAIAAAIGPSAWGHLVSTHQAGFSMSAYGGNLAIAFGGALSLLFAVAVSWDAAAVARSRPAWLYVAICTLTSLTSGTLGAESNHFLEWLAAVAWLAAVLMSAETARNTGRLAVTAVLSVTTLSTFVVFWLPRRDIDPTQCSAAYAFLRSAPQSRVVSEDVTALLTAGKPIQVSDPFAYARLPASTWTDGGLEAGLASGAFDLVAIGDAPVAANDPHHRWSEAFLEALHRRYVPVRSFGCSPSLGVIYAPIGGALQEHR